MGKILAITNRKGGCGKTSSCKDFCVVGSGVVVSAGKESVSSAANTGILKMIIQSMTAANDIILIFLKYIWVSSSFKFGILVHMRQSLLAQFGYIKTAILRWLMQNNGYVYGDLR
ncbi:MAG: hypothetical protein FWD71_09690 [Oscillospiraceae bacterium]|nr:hypothetical protein [Oscillospiraceae bacterium]